MSILRMPAIKAELGHRSHASVYNAQRDGLLPKMVRIGSRSVGLPDYEIRAINTARIAGKSDAEIRELVSRLHLNRTELVSAHELAMGNNTKLPMVEGDSLSRRLRGVSQ